MDKLKTYFVEVVVKKLANQGLQSAIAALLVYMAAHQDLLESLGITTFTWGQWPAANTQPSGLCTLIEWDTLGKGGAAELAAVAMMIVAWIWHHSQATATGAPQSGDLRKTETDPLPGGERKEDPKP